MHEHACDLDDGPCECVMSETMALLGQKYVMELGCVIAAHEPVRFGTIEDHLPEASTSTLSARLDDLTAEGFLTRTQYDEIPPRVEYELTERGEELAQQLRPLAEWASEQ